MNEDARRVVGMVTATALAALVGGCACEVYPGRAEDTEDAEDSGTAIADFDGGDIPDAGLRQLDPLEPDLAFCLFQVHCAPRSPLPSDSVTECLVRLHEYRTGEIAPGFGEPLPERVEEAIACAETAKSCDDYEDCFLGDYRWKCAEKGAGTWCESPSDILHCADAESRPVLTRCEPPLRCESGYCTTGHVCDADDTAFCSKDLSMLLSCSDGAGREARATECREPGFCSAPSGECSGRIFCNKVGSECDGDAVSLCVQAKQGGYARTIECEPGGWRCMEIDGRGRCAPPVRYCDPFTFEDQCKAGHLTVCHEGKRVQVDCGQLGVPGCASDESRCAGGVRAGD